MDLPFIYLDVVYHLGDLEISSGSVSPRDYVKTWDFEFGLLSVSLDPEAWRTGWGGADATIFELRPKDCPFRFIDADVTLQQQRDELLKCALQKGLLDNSGGSVIGTAALYKKLSLTHGSQMPLDGRSDEDQLLQASLAVLASIDQSVHGLWWSDLLNGGMRTERGGIFQHLLSEVNVEIVAQPASLSSRTVVWEASTILA